MQACDLVKNHSLQIQLVYQDSNGCVMYSNYDDRYGQSVRETCSLWDQCKKMHDEVERFKAWKGLPESDLQDAQKWLTHYADRYQAAYGKPFNPKGHDA